MAFSLTVQRRDFPSPLLQLSLFFWRQIRTVIELILKDSLCVGWRHNARIEPLWNSNRLTAELHSKVSLHSKRKDFPVGNGCEHLCKVFFFLPLQCFEFVKLYLCFYRGPACAALWTELIRWELLYQLWYFFFDLIVFFHLKNVGVHFTLNMKNRVSLLSFNLTVLVKQLQ